MNFHGLIPTVTIAISVGIAIAIYFDPTNSLWFILGWAMGLVQGVVHRMMREANSSLQRWGGPSS